MFATIVKKYLQPGDGAFLLFSLLSITLFYLAKQLSIRVPQSGVSELTLWFVGIALLALTARIQMKSLPHLMRVIFVSLFALFALYLAFPRTIPTDVPLGQLVGFRLRYGHWMWPAFCIVGMWRPAFGVLALLGAIWERFTLSAIYGVSLSQTEYFPVSEFALFMLISASLFQAARRFQWWAPLFRDDQPDALTALEKMALCAVAVHMSNYFYSGVKKWLLGDHPLSWVLENQTHYLLLSADAMGLLPLRMVPNLPEMSFKVLGDVHVLSNFLLYGGQLAAVIAVLRIRWLVWLTAFYDLTHIAIFLLTGIFFYKWIVLNFAIIAGLLAIRHKVIPAALKLQLAAIVVAAPLVFWVAHLGWWDSRAFNHERFYAVLDDGNEVEVPTNYWGSLSVNYAQARVTREKSEGFFPTGTFGLLFGQRNMERANQCDYHFEPETSSRVLKQLVEAPESHVIQNVRLHHRYVLEHIAENGRIAYDLYPHHIWSMPWRFTEFDALDKRRIRAYRYVVEAACLRFQDGQFDRELMTRGEYVISVSE